MHDKYCAHTTQSIRSMHRLYSPSESWAIGSICWANERQRKDDMKLMADLADDEDDGCDWMTKRQKSKSWNLILLRLKRPISHSYTIRMSHNNLPTSNAIRLLFSHFTIIHRDHSHKVRFAKSNKVSSEIQIHLFYALCSWYVASLTPATSSGGQKQQQQQLSIFHIHICTIEYHVCLSSTSPSR